MFLIFEDPGIFLYEVRVRGNRGAAAAGTGGTEHPPLPAAAQLTESGGASLYQGPAAASPVELDII